MNAKDQASTLVAVYNNYPALQALIDGLMHNKIDCSNLIYLDDLIYNSDALVGVSPEAKNMLIEYDILVNAVDKSRPGWLSSVSSIIDTILFSQIIHSDKVLILLYIIKKHINKATSNQEALRNVRNLYHEPSIVSCELLKIVLLYMESRDCCDNTEKTKYTNDIIDELQSDKYNVDDTALCYSLIKDMY